MSTFHDTYGSEAMLAGVASQIDSIELMDSTIAIHTISLVLNGQHGEFDLTIEATDADMEDRTWKGIAFRSGGVMDMREV